MSTHQYLNDKVSTELLGQTRSMLKLDLSYLFASIAIITALNIKGADFASSSIVDTVRQFTLLLTYDTAVFLFVFHDWIACNRERGFRWPAPMLAWMTKIQPLFHLFFIVGIIHYGIGMAHGRYGT